MNAVTNTPTNINFLSPIGFKFMIKKAPNVSFFVQDAEIPEVNINPTKHPTPFTDIRVPGDHMEYDPLNISFKVDEDMQGYLELHNWLRGIGFPEDFQEYANLNKENKFLGGGVRTSDVVLTVLTSAKNANYEVIFQEAFPISLSRLDFTSRANSVDFITVNATFAYTKYDIKRIV